MATQPPGEGWGNSFLHALWMIVALIAFAWGRFQKLKHDRHELEERERRREIERRAALERERQRIDHEEEEHRVRIEREEEEHRSKQEQLKLLIQVLQDQAKAAQDELRARRTEDFEAIKKILEGLREQKGG